MRITLLLALASLFFASSLRADLSLELPLSSIPVNRLPYAELTSPWREGFRRRDFTWSDSPPRRYWGQLRLSRMQDTADIYNSGYDFLARFEIAETWAFALWQQELSNFREVELDPDEFDINQIAVTGITQLSVERRVIGTPSMLVSLGLGGVLDNDEDEVIAGGGEAHALIEYYPAKPWLFDLRLGVHAMEREEIRADVWVSFGLQIWYEFTAFVAFRGVYGRGPGFNTISLGSSLVFGFDEF